MVGQVWELCSNAAIPTKAAPIPVIALTAESQVQRFMNLLLIRPQL